MPDPNKETNPGSSDSRNNNRGDLMGPGWIVAVALYLVVASVLVLYGLLKLWPHPTPSGEPKVEAATGAIPTPTAAPTSSAVVAAARPSATQPGAPAQTTPAPTPVPTASSTPAPTPSGKAKLPDPELIYFFNGRFSANIYAETRLLLLVMLAGALGSLMHSVRSLYWYTGNRRMVWSWLAFYLLLPLTGAILSVIFYFVVRGGFFSPQASFENTSPFGFAALSALVGLFSPQATLKLKEIAETIFTRPESGSDSVTATPSITSLNPNTGPAAGGTHVVITGTGFSSGVVVAFGTQPAVVTSSSTNNLGVVAPASTAGAVVVDVEITNPDGHKATLAHGYTYL